LSTAFYGDGKNSSQRILKKPFLERAKLKADDERLRQLQRELERVKEERDILKKALAYFAEDQK